MDASKQLETVPLREQLSEAEARSIGGAALRLPKLRRMLTDAEKSHGSIWVGTGPMSVQHQLNPTDLQAALSLLIERDEQLLASFNVKIVRPE